MFSCFIIRIAKTIYKKLPIIIVCECCLSRYHLRAYNKKVIDLNIIPKYVFGNTVGAKNELECVD